MSRSDRDVPAAAPASPPTAGPFSDEDLAVAAAAGDHGAFARLYDRYRERLRCFVTWQVGGGDQRADELVQEVFFQTYRSLDRFGGRSRFRTWLYGVARNVCLHDRRRRLRRPAIGSGGAGAPDRAGGGTGAEEPALEEIPDLEPGIAERLALAERRRAVRRELDRLPAIYRTALLLRDWEELSYAEMAEVLAVPVGTVRSRLHKARATLARALRDLMDED